MSPPAAAVVVTALAAVSLFSSASAFAEDEVRIAIASGSTKVSIGGKDLAIYDAATGDRWASAPGTSDLIFTLETGGVSISGKPLVKDRDRLLRESWIVEGPHGVRVSGRLYLGRVSVGRAAGKKTLIAINRLPLETYLLGIVGSEMSPAWPMEALKAQAVAARTYALERRMMMRAANKPYDLESTVLSQVYQGAEKIRPSIVQAVVETRGEVLAFKHRLAQALFHSTCGGTTVSAREAFGNAVPYLNPRKCGYCNDSNRYRWQMTMKLDQIESKLKKAKLISGKLEKIERSKMGGTVEVTAGKKLLKLSPKAIRAALGYTVLLSERFTAKTKAKEVKLEGMGFGHGVGMCQWGARGQADQGLGYRDILDRYYAGAKVRRLY